MKCTKCGYDDMGTGSAHVCIPFNYVDVEDAAAPAPAEQDEREALRNRILTETAYCDGRLTNEEARAAPQDAQERNAIIEECAKVADAWKEESVAEAIRALKTAQPADKPLFDKAKIEQMMTTAKGKGMDLG